MLRRCQKKCFKRSYLLSWFMKKPAFINIMNIRMKWKTKAISFSLSLCLQTLAANSSLINWDIWQKFVSVGLEKKAMAAVPKGCARKSFGKHNVFFAHKATDSLFFYKQTLKIINLKSFQSNKKNLWIVYSLTQLL